MGLLIDGHECASPPDRGVRTRAQLTTTQSIEGIDFETGTGAVGNMNLIMGDRNFGAAGGPSTLDISGSLHTLASDFVL